MCHLQVACGHTHTIALDDKGAAFTWGNGNYGKLGHKVCEVHSECHNKSQMLLIHTPPHGPHTQQQEQHCNTATGIPKEESSEQRGQSTTQ